MIGEKYHDSLILKRNTDSQGNPVSINIVDIKPVMDNHSCIVLSQIPDEYYGLSIEGYSEVFDVENVGAKDYKVDYANGVVYFNPVNIGKTITIDYKGIGCELIYSSRVASKLDAYGNVVETLEEMIEKGKNYLKLIETLGNAVTIINKLELEIKEGQTLYDLLHNDIAIGKPLQEILHSDIVEASKWKDQLHKDVTDGKVLQPLLQQTVDDAEDVKVRLDKSVADAQDDIATIEATGNKEVIIKSSDWVLNDDIYEKEITHPCNSENLHVTAKNADTKKACTVGWQVLDKTRILLKSDEAINMSIILSASYYHATQTISDDIAEEVLKARKGETGLDVKITKIDEDIITTNNKMVELETNLDKKIDDEVIELEKSLDENFATYEGTINSRISTFKTEVNESITDIKSIYYVKNVSELEKAIEKSNSIPSKIYLINGTYNLTKVLYVPSNTELIGLGQVIIQADGLQCYIINKSLEGALGYNGSKNIHIENITFNGKSKADGLTMLAFGHAEHITIKDCIFTDLHMWHMIELNAVQHGLIYGCKFKNYGNVGANATEAIQLDAMLGEAQFPWFGSYDNTACRFITIENNTFEDIGKTAIGHHSFKSGVVLRDVLIKNNFFNRVNTCINLIDFKNLTITENKAYDMHGFFMSQNANNDCNVLNISKNLVQGYFINSIDGLGDERFIGINTGGKPDTFNFYHITITENDISLLPGHAIGLIGDYVTITNNNFNRIYRNGIYHWGGQCANISNNNFRDVGMATDTTRYAILVDGGGAKGSRVVISNNTVANLYGIGVNVGSKGVDKVLVANNVSAVTNNASTSCTVVNNIN